MVKRVRGAAVGIGVTIGFLALLAIAAKKTNVGDFLQSSLRGFGQNVGEGITAPFTGIVEGVTLGASNLGESAASLSEGFQRSVSKTLGFGDKVFSELNPTGEDTSVQPGKTQLDLSKFFSNTAISNRIAQTTKASAGTGKPLEIGGTRFGEGFEFGGFGSAEAQETALQKAIRESAEQFPQFFNAGG